MCLSRLSNHNTHISHFTKLLDRFLMLCPAGDGNFTTPIFFIMIQGLNNSLSKGVFMRSIEGSFPWYMLADTLILM